MNIINKRKMEQWEPTICSERYRRNNGNERYKINNRDYEEDEVIKRGKITCPHSKSKYTEVNMLTRKGLIKLIQHSRKNISNNIKNLLNKYKIEVTEHKYTPIETSTIEIIKKVFNGKIMKEQYAAKGHRIDLYFEEYKIAIECDEKHHNYTYEKDKKHIKI